MKLIKFIYFALFSLFLFSFCSDDPAPKNNETEILEMIVEVGTSLRLVTFNEENTAIINLENEEELPTSLSVEVIILSSGARGVNKNDSLDVIGNTTSFIITAEDGHTTKLYNIKLNLAFSSEANVLGLRFSLDNNTYDVVFPLREATVIVPYYTTLDTQQSVTIQFVSLSEGATGIYLNDTFNLETDPTPNFFFNVISQNIEANNKYVVFFKKGKNTEAKINSMSITLESANYAVNFVNAFGTITIPYGTNVPSQVTINSISLSNGASGPIEGETINVNNNHSLVTITAENITFVSIYSLRFITEPDSLSELKQLTLTISGIDYDVDLDNDTTLPNGNSVGKLNFPFGVALPSSGDIVKVKYFNTSINATGLTIEQNLTITSNTSTIKITSGNTRYFTNYIIQYANLPNHEANIINLKITVNGNDYDTSFNSENKAKIILPYGEIIPMSSTVKNITLSQNATGLSSLDPLTIINQLSMINITAENGDIYTYTIKYQITPDTATNIAELFLTINNTEYEVNFNQNNYAEVHLPYLSTIPSSVRIERAAISIGATGITTGGVLPINSSFSNIRIIGQDGTTTKDYNIKYIISPPNTDNTIRSLVLTIAGNDYPISFGMLDAATLKLNPGVTAPNTILVKAIAIHQKAISNLPNNNRLLVTGSTVQIKITSENGNTKTYTVIIEDTKRVTFNLIDNTLPAILDQVVITGNKVNYPPTPVKYGYAFKGWYKSTVFSEANLFDFDAELINNDITLYANWDFLLIALGDPSDASPQLKPAYLFSSIFNLDILIPQIIDSKRIIHLHDYLFSNHHMIRTLKLENGISTIGKNTFSQCTELRKIELPSTTLKVIKEKAFEGCYNLTKINLPNSLDTIASNAFEGCTRLSVTNFPNSINRIGSYAFLYCFNLQNIVLPTNLKVIEHSTFAFTGLTNIQIPSSVTEIKSSAFESCQGLTSVTIPNTVTKIETLAFSRCINAVIRIEHLTPPTIQSQAFGSISTSTAPKKILVPPGKSAIYKIATIWKNYKDIIFEY